MCGCVCVCVCGGGGADWLLASVASVFGKASEIFIKPLAHAPENNKSYFFFDVAFTVFFFFFASCWLKFCLTPRRFRWSLCFTGRSCTLFWGITTALLKGNAQRSTSGFTFVVSRLNILCLLKIVKVTHSLFCFLWARKRFGFRFLYGSNWTRSGKQTSHVRRRRAGFTWQV